MSEQMAGGTLWERIAHSLRDEIVSGNAQPGSQLPTESELAARFGVNRHTVRRALAALGNEGFVEATRGRGTFVASHPIHYPISTRTRFSEIMSAQDLQPGGQLITSTTARADDNIARKLGILAGAPLFRLEILRVANGQPVALATSWFVAGLVPNLINDYAETGSITKALERGGFANYRRKSSWISASPATGNERRHLRLAAKAPVLVVESVNVADDGTPLQYAITHFAGDAVQLLIENPTP